MGWFVSIERKQNVMYGNDQNYVDSLRRPSTAPKGHPIRSVLIGVLIGFVIGVGMLALQMMAAR